MPKIGDKGGYVPRARPVEPQGAPRAPAPPAEKASPEQTIDAAYALLGIAGAGAPARPPTPAERPVEPSAKRKREDEPVALRLQYGAAAAHHEPLAAPRKQPRVRKAARIEPVVDPRLLEIRSLARKLRRSDPNLGVHAIALARDVVDGASAWVEAATLARGVHTAPRRHPEKGRYFGPHRTIDAFPDGQLFVRLQTKRGSGSFKVAKRALRLVQDDDDHFHARAAVKLSIELKDQDDVADVRRERENMDDVRQLPGLLTYYAFAEIFEDPYGSDPTHVNIYVPEKEQTLKQALFPQPVEEEDALPLRTFSGAQKKRFARELLESLDALHGIGCVHLDVKPANCLIGAGGDDADLSDEDDDDDVELDAERPPLDDEALHLTLTDLGLMREEGVETSAGTLRYMAPSLLHDLARGVEERRAADDMHAAGLTLFELVYERDFPLPESGARNRKRDARDVRDQLIRMKPEAWTAWVEAHVPDDAMGRLIRKLVSYDEDDRPSAADAMVALDAIDDGVLDAASLPDP